MGVGPWQQAEMMRDVEKRERARFRRIIRRRIAHVQRDNEDWSKYSVELLLKAMLVEVTPKEERRGKNSSVRGPVQSRVQAERVERS